MIHQLPHQKIPSGVSANPSEKQQKSSSVYSINRIRPEPSKALYEIGIASCFYRSGEMPVSTVHDVRDYRELFL